MDRDAFIAEFRSWLCSFYGYDDSLKYVGSAKSVQPKSRGKAPLQPRDFLKFAIDDSEGLDQKRNQVNCLGNCKRAIDAQVDRLIQRIGFLPLARKQSWKIPKKLAFISQSGVVAPRILRRLTRLRNRLEHEFAPPSRREVEDALDVAALFVSYAELVRVPSLNWTLPDKRSVSCDYDQMVFYFFNRDTADSQNSEAAPLFSLAHGEQGFQEFYNFLAKTIPLMETKGI